MLLCLDIGNSHLFGGVFDNNKLLLSFRYPSKETITSDLIGIFLKSVLRENHLDPESIHQIAICSVVPSLDYSIRAACIKYFRVHPFLLRPGVKTGLKIKFKNPSQVGSDRIANAIAAEDLFPSKPIIIVDLGTATTCCAVSANKEYLGGVIMAGLKISMQALHDNAALLSQVKIEKPKSIIGRSTEDNIQSGLYFGKLGMLKEVIFHLKKETFPECEPVIIGTGGFAQLFESEKLFHTIIPELVLFGLQKAFFMNIAQTLPSSVVL